MHHLLDAIAGAVLGPFQSQETFISAGLRCVRLLTSLQSRTAWLYILTSGAIGAMIYVIGRRRGQIGTSSLLRFLLPRGIYLHPSAIVDYKYFLFDQTVSFVLYVPLIGAVSMLAYKATNTAFSAMAALGFHPGNALAGTILLPVVIILAADFAFFVAHYLMHKIPVLWCFHAVHHSAAVLTPITSYRNHPVDELVNRTVWAALGGIGAAFYTSKTGNVVSLPTMLGLNVVEFCFFAFAFQLRHSHIWLSYGPVLSRIFISPAQHQIHHSVEGRHWDRNFGFMFALWDLLFRTLYVPVGREKFATGIAGADPQDFATLPRLYVLPFLKAARLLREGTVRCVNLIARGDRSSWIPHSGTRVAAAPRPSSQPKPL